ncbi:MAG TPA: glycosyl hydrolase family 28 protein [Mariniphaga sp.]|nr:glycosyl hydrolase family 28 protein [Mariniphaga sp.]
MNLNFSINLYNITRKTLIYAILLIVVATAGCNFSNKSALHDSKGITPNQFEGTDTERIQAAVDKAVESSGRVIIPADNSNGTNIWLLDNAILLPGDITVILDNCIIQLSDSCRDNMFRSKNVGEGIVNPGWNKNISIIGIGEATLKGAANPRSTGDGGKKLSLNPDADIEASGDWRISYGTDAGKADRKHTGDWRNILILMAYVDGFKLKNVNIENTHAWAVSHERVINAELSNIRINNPERSTINGKSQLVRNRDGINLRHGCKNFRIDNISGKTGDDFVALSTLGLYSEHSEGGTLNSTMVTSRKWHGPEDDTENVYITNLVCESATRAVAIRANDVAGISQVYVNGVIFEGGYNALLVGGRGYGRNSQPGKINNVHAMNIMGDGRSLIQIEEPIANCSFINGLYRGDGDEVVLYVNDKKETTNVIVDGITVMK